jgi:hypothetical protein
MLKGGLLKSSSSFLTPLFEDIYHARYTTCSLGILDYFEMDSNTIRWVCLRHYTSVEAVCVVSQCNLHSSKGVGQYITTTVGI